MKIRTSFIANSSSSSFLLLVKNDDPPKLKLNEFATITVLENNDITIDDEDDLPNYHNGIILTQTPKTINEVFNNAMNYLINQWEYNNLIKFPDSNAASKSEFTISNMRSFYTWSTSTKKNNNDLPDENTVENYYNNLYDYLVDAYKLTKKCLTTYYKEFIDQRIDDITGHAYSCNTFKEFFESCKLLDSSEGMMFGQILTTYDSYMSIFKKHPISFSYNDFKIYTDKKEIKTLSIKNYKLFCDIYYNTIKILYLYLYCHYTNRSLQSISIPYNSNSSIEEFIINAFELANKNFLETCANFELITCEY